jgi:hypothetical protein
MLVPAEIVGNGDSEQLNEVTRSTEPLLTTMSGGGFNRIGPSIISFIFFVLMFIRFCRDHLTGWPTASDWSMGRLQLRRVLHIIDEF